MDIRNEIVNIFSIEESPINAQEMKETDFNRLVANLKKDKVLTSSVLLMEQENKKFMCISGHHRLRACLKIGIKDIPAIIIPQVDDSTRIRLQLSHNDIHGEPNKEILKMLQKLLDEKDYGFVEYFDTEEIKEENNQEIEIENVNFTYINVCLLEDSRKSLIEIIEMLRKKEDEKWLIEKEEYSKMKDLLTIAFKNGFKTPGQAFRKFLDIVENNIELIKK